MKRRTLLLGAALAGGAVAAGAGALMYRASGEGRVRASLVIGGSSIVLRFVQILADDFARRFPNLDILLEGGDSYSGLVALERRAVDLGMMSRELEPDENRLHLHNRLIGIESVALVVHPGLGIADLSEEQARHAMEGTIANWKELGGPDAPIQLFGRKEGSTTRTTIEGVLLHGATQSRKARELDSSREMLAAVAGNPHGLGFLSARNLDASVKALAINGVAATHSAVLLKQYPLVRDLFLLQGDEASPWARRFVEHALSEEGQKLLADSGLVRVA